MNGDASEPLDEATLAEVQPLEKASRDRVEPYFALESAKYKLEKERIDLAREIAKLESYRHDIRTRRFYARGLFNVTVIWLAAVLTILVLDGRGWLTLSDRVLTTLLTTTTIQVLALIGAVIAYLFKGKKPGSQSERGTGRRGQQHNRDT